MTVQPAKQPYEKFQVEFDFTNYLGSANISTIDEIVSYDNETGLAADVELYLGSYQTNGKKVWPWIYQGTDGVTYKLTCRVIDSAARQWELDMVIPISD